jgi:hypothetical protein
LLEQQQPNRVFFPVWEKPFGYLNQRRKSMSNVVSIFANESSLDEPRYIDFPDKFEVGQRIHCGLYGGKDGTIIAIHGKQSPDSIQSIRGVCVTGGSAEIDVAWDTDGERGGFSMRVPEAIARGVQWKMLSGYRNPKAAEAESRLYEQKAREKAEAEKIAFANAKEKVKEEFPYLTVDDQNDRNIVQKNLRAILKRNFPGVKFRVTKDGYSARRVCWTDGPTVESVKQFTSIFEHGRFNGMEDIYETDVSPFNEVFGSCDYIFEERSYSDEFIQKAIEHVWGKYASGFKCQEKPTVEMYRRGGMRNLVHSGLGDDFSELMWGYMTKTEN